MISAPVSVHRYGRAQPTLCDAPRAAGYPINRQRLALIQTETVSRSSQPPSVWDNAASLHSKGVPRMTDETKIYSELSEIFRDVFMDDDMQLTPELSAKDVAGWDSFKQIEIMVSVEERFHLKLNTKEIDSLKCVGDLVRVIAKRSREVG
jgi:acyl carrier protein